jgi:hypothetical protein
LLLLLALSKIYGIQSSFASFILLFFYPINKSRISLASSHKFFLLSATLSFQNSLALATFNEWTLKCGNIYPKSAAKVVWGIKARRKINVAEQLKFAGREREKKKRILPKSIGTTRRTSERDLYRVVFF